MEARTAEVLVDRLTRDWRAGPRITVVPTVDAFPVAAPSDARGVIIGSDVYLLGTLPSGLFVKTLAHEATHFSLRQHFSPSEWRVFMGAVRAGVRQGDPVLVELSQHVRRTYLDRRGQFALRPLAESDEVAAAMAEHLADPKTGELATSLRARWHALRGYVLREVAHVYEPVTALELAGTLHAASLRIRRGGGPIRTLTRRAWAVLGCGSMQGEKPRGPRVPAKNLRESSQMLANARQDDESWMWTKLAGTGLFLILWIVGAGYVALQLITWLARG